MIVLGIDPGERWTGYALRSGARDLLDWRVIDRTRIAPGAERVTQAYLGAAEANAWDLLRQHHYDELVDTGAVTIAIEEFADPVGFRQIPPRVLVGIGRVCGWLQRAFPTAVMVPAYVAGHEGKKGGHGRHALLSYPDELVTKGERASAHRRGTWTLPAPQNAEIRHARSAWDVAGDAINAARYDSAVTAERLRRDADYGRIA